MRTVGAAGGAACASPASCIAAIASPRPRRASEYISLQRRESSTSDRRLHSTCHTTPERRARTSGATPRARRVCGDVRAAHPQRASRPSSPDEEAWQRRPYERRGRAVRAYQLVYQVQYSSTP